MANDPLERFKTVPTFTVTSDDVAEGRPLSREQWGAGGGGGDVSPQLSWSGFPAETKSFAVTIHDPDAPTGSGFWHWAVYNIPASVTELPSNAGVEGGAGLPAGAAMLSNEMRSKSFTGAGPPPGTGTHHYNIVVHALDVEHLDLDPESTPAVLGFNAHFHTLARAVITPVATAGDI
ncbi:YbhB/YbcL family Raf kinase inhibitor-like protein [Leifsonia sp. C5G2]|uniref:YbhB/YbcL family Raf kinase inhibitor-like protein n=1 Tax=Leifsonia sp. C5G2 TaxID=2735269 RepID=UPI0015853B25|nr:YbhB/YbcL family Raf kinase inhibitor-like protein [Leifsonia sp. C5G2]NUU06800.1 YbhB/YbcL family Raf kinase inhibitor-like protein [Leifsonia sp. C5G2]